jgi:hypothetical protein
MSYYLTKIAITTYVGALHSRGAALIGRRIGEHADHGDVAGDDVRVGVAIEHSLYVGEEASAPRRSR